MKFWQELKQLIKLVLNAFLPIANSKHACTDCQRKEISSKRQDLCHFIPIFSRTLPFNCSAYLHEIFLLIRRSCVLCLTINFFALFIDRAAVFSNTVSVCKSGLWHSSCSMSCCAVGYLQAAI